MKIEKTLPSRAARWFVNAIFAFALVASLGLAWAGCAGISGGSPQFAVEICVVHPEYGKICGSLLNGVVTIKADAQLPPELRSSIEESIRKLAKR